MKLITLLAGLVILLLLSACGGGESHVSASTGYDYGYYNRYGYYNDPYYYNNWYYRNNPRYYGYPHHSYDRDDYAKGGEHHEYRHRY